jgi:hypothetical protein
MAAKMAMMAMTTRSSIKVNARRLAWDAKRVKREFLISVIFIDGDLI